jgi:hypothetical protein
LCGECRDLLLVQALQRSVRNRIHRMLFEEQPIIKSLAV